MMLLVLFFILTGPYIVLTLAERLKLGAGGSESLKWRLGLSLFLLMGTLGHFARTVQMAEMLPHIVPMRIGIVYITGVLEALAVIGLWMPRWVKLTGLCLVLYFIAVLPANIYAAFNYIDFGGHGNGPAYLLVRVPFQLLLIWVTYEATGQEWFSKK